MSFTRKNKFKLVGVEREDSFNNSVFGTSGLMLDRKYIITTATIIWPLLDHNFFQEFFLIKPGEIFSFNAIRKLPVLKIIWKNDENLDTYCVQDGNIFAAFFSDNIKLTARQFLQGWSVDTSDNSKELETILSLFFVITIVPTGTVSDFKDCLIQWWDLVKNKKINQCDEVLVKSVSFGNRHFLNSFSKGIVSNIVGNGLCLILSDCPVTPGSEGSPVYKNSHSDVPCGVVISSSCWWKGDWTGLTLIADIRAILLELVKFNHYTTNLTHIPNHRLIAAVETTLVQVYCGGQRGTAVVIDVESGTLLTNSHVVDMNCDVKIYCKGAVNEATVVYKTSDKEVYDLAVLQCKPSFLNSNNMLSVTISQKPVNTGDAVYGAGFAIFTNTMNCSPTISKGFVIQSNTSMLKTTCCVNPGMSGGIILNCLGELLGIIVCNSKVQNNIYPRFNLAIPSTLVQDLFKEYLKHKDSSFLSKFFVENRTKINEWIFFESKL